MSALEGNDHSSSGAVPSEAINAPESITAARVLCTNSFNRLIESLRVSNHSKCLEPYICAVAVDRELDRFKLWEANIQNVQHASRHPSEDIKASTKVLVIDTLRLLNYSLSECKCMSTGL